MHLHRLGATAAKLQKHSRTYVVLLTQCQCTELVLIVFAPADQVFVVNRSCMLQAPDTSDPVYVCVNPAVPIDVRRTAHSAHTHASWSTGNPVAYPRRVPRQRAGLPLDLFCPRRGQAVHGPCLWMAPGLPRDLCTARGACRDRFLSFATLFCHRRRLGRARYQPHRRISLPRRGTATLSSYNTHAPCFLCTAFPS